MGSGVPIPSVTFATSAHVMRGMEEETDVEVERKVWPELELEIHVCRCLPSGPPGTICETLIVDRFWEAWFAYQNRRCLICLFSKGLCFGTWGRTNRPRGPLGTGRYTRDAEVAEDAHMAHLRLGSTLIGLVSSWARFAEFGMISGKTTPGWPRWRRIRNEPCVRMYSHTVIHVHVPSYTCGCTYGVACACGSSYAYEWWVAT